MKLREEDPWRTRFLILLGGNCLTYSVWFGCFLFIFNLKKERRGSQKEVREGFRWSMTRKAHPPPLHQFINAHDFLFAVKASIMIPSRKLLLNPYPVLPCSMCRSVGFSLAGPSHRNRTPSGSRCTTIVLQESGFGQYQLHYRKIWFEIT